MHYLTLLKSKIKNTPKASHAFKEYCNIITKYSHMIGAKKPNDDCCYETHHIYPKTYCKHDCKTGIRDKDNLIVLQADIHYIAHYWLAIAIDDYPMLASFNLMSNFKDQNGSDDILENSKEYHDLKKRIKEAQSDERRAYFSNKGKTVKGYKQMHNPDTQEQKMIDPTLVVEYISKGWVLGVNDASRKGLGDASRDYYKNNPSHSIGLINMFNAKLDSEIRCKPNDVDKNLKLGYIIGRRKYEKIPCPHCARNISPHHIKGHIKYTHKL